MTDDKHCSTLPLAAELQAAIDDSRPSLSTDEVIAVLERDAAESGLFDPHVKTKQD